MFKNFGCLEFFGDRRFRGPPLYAPAATWVPFAYPSEQRGGPCIRVRYCPNLSINSLSIRLEQIAKMKINRYYL